MKQLACPLAVACLLGHPALEARAQAGFEVTIPQDQLECLVDNQDRYLGIPRPIIDFFVDLCPAISGEEAAALAQNSGVDPAGDPRPSLLMTKDDFRCLLAKIDAHLAEAPENEGADVETTDEVSFVLDCEG